VSAPNGSLPVAEVAKAPVIHDGLVAIAIPVFSILPPEPDSRDRHVPDYLPHEQRLADDISKRGVRQPIYVLRLQNGAFRALTGWTRTLASRRAGKETIPAFVLDRSLTEAEQEMEKLLENEMRQDFTPQELACIYQRLMQLNGWSQSELAKNVHASPAQVAKVLAISTKLCPEAKELVAGGKLPPRAAYAISRLPMHLQAEVSRKAAELPMSAESVEEAVHRLLGKKVKGPGAVKAKTDGVLLQTPGDWTWEKVKELGEKLKTAAARGEKMGAPVTFLSNLLKGG
jgi:ParB family chromosome partitioning protein